MQENQHKFSTVQLKAFVAMFGIFLLALCAIDQKSVVPLYFLPGIALVVWAVGKDERDEVNDPENWEGI